MHRGQRLCNNLNKVLALVALVKLSILFVTGWRIWQENLRLQCLKLKL